MNPIAARAGRTRAMVLGLTAALALGFLGPLAEARPVDRGQVQVPTTVEDFFQPGTQPDPGATQLKEIQSSTTCIICHGEYMGLESWDEPWDGWVHSMMGQSARDPIWYAALAIANQDAAFAGDLCIRCHSPGAWTGGRSNPPDGSGFIVDGPRNDFDGVTCHFCHRLVNPVLEADSPPEDAKILAALEYPPGDKRANGRYVLDPSDVRRGPYDDVPMNLMGVPIIPSPSQRRSELCATCHDLGNPVFMRQPDGTYAVTDLGAPHPTQDPYDMFPEQMTYSEWLNSQFAAGGVPFPDGRFGGNHPTGVMEECQDCHMPDVFMGGSWAWEWPPFFPRPDVARHNVVGSNTWVLQTLREIYPDSQTELSAEGIDAARARTIDLLRAGSDMQAMQVGATLRVRVINFSGHKLPTGVPEGRRMWINVEFYDALEYLIVDHGHYVYATGTLFADDTKVYEAIHGFDDTVAQVVGLPAGPSSHLALNNQILFDNRIPPIGFTNAAYAEFGSAPTGYEYPDGQYWDDTIYPIPPDARSAVVTLYYQSMTKEYIEFLRDTNVTNGDGQLAYDLWADPAIGNKAPPVDMDSLVVVLGEPLVGDLNGDGVVDVADLLLLLSDWGPCPPPTMCTADLDGDGLIGVTDLLQMLSGWGL